MDEVLIFAERIAQLSLAAAYLGGVILAICFWSRYPRPALYLAIAASLSLLVELAFIASWVEFERDLDDDNFYTVLNTVDSCVRIGAFGLLTLAIFAARKRSPRELEDFESH